MSSHQHPDHHAEIRRIKRIIGQLEGVQKMIEERRYCIDILNQTKAISSAVHSLETSLLEKHLNHCLVDAMTTSKHQQQEKIREVLELFRKRLK